jgi:hypothetical protein
VIAAPASPFPALFPVGSRPRSKETETSSLTRQSQHLDALARRWWLAFETAGSALRAAGPYLGGQDLGERSRRLVEERSDVARLLQSLARDLQAESGFVRWLAAPTNR